MQHLVARVPCRFCSPAAQVDAIFSSTDGKQIALRVSSMHLTDGDEVPGTNVWPHITVACEKVGMLQFSFAMVCFVCLTLGLQGQAWLSNKLPEMQEQGTATVTPINPPVTLACVISGEAKNAP